MEKNRDKEKRFYISQWIAFNGEGKCSFYNDFARNAIIFAVDISPFLHAHNRQNNFLVLDEGDTFGINGS